MRADLRFWGGLLLGGLTFLASRLPAGETRTLIAEPASGTEMAASVWLTTVPSSGCFPVRVTVRNETDASRQWQITANTRAGYRDANLEFQAPLRAESRASATVELMVPVVTTRDNNLPNLTLAVTGPQAGDTRVTWNAAGRWGDRSEFVAMAESLHVLGWGPLESWVEKPPAPHTRQSLTGCKISPAGAPMDWRGYSGLGSLWITLEDWDAWPAPSRPALLQWIAQGGRLYLVGTDLTSTRLQSSGLPAPEGDVIRMGLGQVKLFPWDGKLLKAESAGRLLLASDSSVAAGRIEDYTSAWPLVSQLGAVAINVPFVIIFIIAFAILVAPVNLFIFAGRGRRHRMFWTTPLISLAASLVLGAVIVMQDGFGGTGARVILASFLPDQKSVAIVQEQAARTGVLLDTEFDLTEPATLAPLYFGTGGGTRSRNYFERGMRRGGDWFASRAAQGHLLRAVRSTRGGVEFRPATGDAAPSVVSSLGLDLATLFVQDDAGKWWTATQVHPGELKRLVPAPENALKTWREAAAPGGSVMRSLLDRVGSPRNHFFGIATEPDKLAIATLPSIRWRSQTALCVGPLTSPAP
jgi:hypothetical protein